MLISYWSTFVHLLLDALFEYAFQQSLQLLKECQIKKKKLQLRIPFILHNHLEGYVFDFI